MINSKQVKKIKELEPYLNSGKPAPANDIIDLYNEVFGPNPKTGRKVGYTSCGSCLRHRLIELINAVKIEDRERTEKARLAKEKKEQAKKAIPNAFANGIEGVGVHPSVLTVKK